MSICRNGVIVELSSVRHSAIRSKLERLQQLADDHFGHAPDAIHWGLVGELGRTEAGLDGLLAIFGGDDE